MGPAGRAAAAQALPAPGSGGPEEGGGGKAQGLLRGAHGSPDPGVCGGAGSVRSCPAAPRSVAGPPAEVYESRTGSPVSGSRPPPRLRQQPVVAVRWGAAWAVTAPSPATQPTFATAASSARRATSATSSSTRRGSTSTLPRRRS